MDSETQVMSHFPEWKEHVQADVVQLKSLEVSIKNLQKKLIELINLSTKNYDELGMIFNSFSIFQSFLRKYI